MLIKDLSIGAELLTVVEMVEMVEMVGPAGVWVGVAPRPTPT